MNQRHRLLALSLVLLAVGGLVFASLPYSVTRAQNGEPETPQGSQSEPIVRQADAFAISPPLADIDVSDKPIESFRRGRVEANEERPQQVTTPPLSGEVDSEQALQETIQSSAPDASAAATTTNFEGLSSDDNARVLGFRVAPPDPSGDVGRTQYLQAVNDLFRVYNKSTGAPLMDARPISALFDSLPATARCRRRDDGDPIVLYDSFADRWFISQFVSPDSVPSEQNEAPYAQCIAVSQTNDATGAYYVYEFTSPNNKFGDYPKYGVWPDAYYSTVNQFVGGFRSVGVYAYDREKILRGDPTATYLYFDLEGRFPNQTPRGMLPSDADGLLPPPAGAPNVFTYYNANEFAREIDSLRLFDFRANFANPSASSFTERADSPLPVAPFDPRNPTGADDIEQPRPAPPNAYLDAIADRLMQRFQYRNFGNSEAWTVNHTVNVGTTPTTFAQYRAAPRYYELRRAPGGTFTVRNQGTFAPDTNERWMGSTALDSQGNLALGYSVSSTSVYPSIRYTGRLATDAPNTLQSEQEIVAGTGVQTNANSRWGDYSQMSVDPTDDCTFYYTQEYYQTADRTPATSPFGVNWQTRVGSFKFAPCSAPSQGTLTISVRNCEGNTFVRGASITIDGTLYGSTGPNGTFAANLPPGTYTIVISAPGFSTPITQSVTITANGASTIDVCLVPSPRVVVESVSMVNESCGVANGAVDPGETVTVNVTLRNNGTATVSNLVATLQATGGVTAPSGSQNYGTLAPGQSATRPFTFTAANLACGSDITLTFQLQDGVTDLGTATSTLALGTLVTSPVFSENFDSVTPPALPPGWTTSTTGAPPPTPTPSPSPSPTPTPIPPPAPWRTTTAFRDTLPNSAATTDNPYPSTSTLVSPVIAIPGSTGTGSGARLTFRNYYTLEEDFDGGVLEISINGGAFQDILAAGGAFEAGGYNTTLLAGTGNPLAGRRAWSGNTNRFITTTVRLPSGTVGQNVQFRWVMGTDAFVEVANGGWRIDTVSISSGTRACCVTQATDGGGGGSDSNNGGSGSDTQANTKNIDSVDGFVYQQYRDFLNRQPDDAGFQFWKGTLQAQLDKCGTADNAEANTCRARAKAAVSEAFFVSVEFQQTGYLVYRLYKVGLDPAARPRGLPRYAEFLRAAQATGAGVIVNAPGWEQKLEANKQTFIREFAQRPEFLSRYPETMTKLDFIRKLFQTAGLQPTEEELDDAARLYDQGGIEGRARALRSVAESKRLFLQEFNKAFVLMQYFGYLRRNADEGEDANRPFAGYDFWLAKLNAESGDTTRFNTIDELLAPTKRARMVEAFVITGEYRRRFGPE